MFYNKNAMREGYKNWNAKMHKEGFRVEIAIPKGSLEKGISEYFKEKNGNLTNLLIYKVIAGDVAMKGEEWVPAEQVYLVYTKPKTKGTRWDRDAMQHLKIKCRNVNTGELEDRIP